jgi:hypothetical protein
MSINTTSASTVHREKTLDPTLSQSENYSYSRYPVKARRQPSFIKNRRMSVGVQNSGDVLTHLSSLPSTLNKQENPTPMRRFSELKPSLIQQVEKPKISERRNSTPHINLSALFPNPFRHNKHQHDKNTTK